jgi:hypothetical protein
MHCECTFPPHQPNLKRVVSGQTSNRGKQGGALPRSARQGARWCTPTYMGVPIGSGVAARVPGFGVLLAAERAVRAFPVACTKIEARDDPAQRCCEGARRGRQGEAPRRLACRPPADRQGALPRTVVCAGGAPIGRTDCFARGSTRVPLEYSSSTRQHARVLLSSLEWLHAIARTYAHQQTLRPRRHWRSRRTRRPRKGRMRRRPGKSSRRRPGKSSRRSRPRRRRRRRRPRRSTNARCGRTNLQCCASLAVSLGSAR